MLIESETFGGSSDHSLKYAISTYVVQKLGTSISVYVVGVEVTPPELNIDPILVTSDSVKRILALQQSLEKPSTI